MKHYIKVSSQQHLILFFKELAYLDYVQSLQNVDFLLKPTRRQPARRHNLSGSTF